MFHPGDLVIYGGSGVCRVAAVGWPEGLSCADKNRAYYTLTPLYGTEVIYIPVDSGVFMRPVLSREQAEELVGRIPFIREEVIAEKSPSGLKERYDRFFQTHACEDLVQLIKSVYGKNRRAAGAGKKSAPMDQRYMKRAEDLLYGELAAALGIPLDEVVPYIERRARDAGCAAPAPS